MNSFVEVMKKVAEKEAEKIYTMELGVVTSVFPHASGSDKDNYQCSVKLKNKKQPDGSDFELRKVPVATQHMGLANIPNVGDLVVVAFVSGNINAPIILGRLYNDEDKPPVNKEKEFLLQHDLKGGGMLKIDSAGIVTITSKNEQCAIKVENGGVTIDVASNNVTVKSTGTIKIGDGATSSVEVGGRASANAVADGDDIILSTHTHLGNLGIPCPVLVPTEKINSIQAKLRNTKVG